MITLRTGALFAAAIAFLSIASACGTPAPVKPANQYSTSFSQATPSTSATSGRSTPGLISNTPCAGTALDKCRARQSDLSANAQSACTADGQRPICIMPLGQIDSTLVHRLVAYYKDNNDLTLTVLGPQSVDRTQIIGVHGQIDATRLIEYMRSRLGNPFEPSPYTIIGLTPIDLHNADDPNNNYIFGLKDTPNNPVGVLSTYHMDPRTYGLPQDEDVIFQRMSKMLSRYIAFLYYGMPLNNDPTSVLTSSIGRLDDLDAITGGLPTPAPKS